MTLLDIAERPEPVYTTPKKTRTQLVADYFREHPNEWIDGLVFERFAGAYGWRSRISDARRTGMVIENRQRSTSDGKTVSEYRYVPEWIHSLGNDSAPVKPSERGE